jgi:hypothetical protein
VEDCAESWWVDERRGRVCDEFGEFCEQCDDSEGGIKVSFATPTGTMGGVSVQYPARDAVMTIRDVGGGAEDLVVTLNGGSSGRVEVDGLPGGKYEVQMVSKA